jgi:eukaryotic-like serine/threonine-protein kinase
MGLTRLGRYDVTRPIGRGAMGVVYLARDPLIERTVAIKTVACSGLSEKEAAEFEERFFREAKSAGRLNHPNIVTVHDVGRDGELAWIAMEFLAGKSLRDLLDTGTPLSHERIIDIVAAVADALATAHTQDIVHRDIKPANIMVLDNGVVKLADFGIAQLPGSGLTMAGAVLGSPKYMSPEQVAGEKADGRSDIFSLGVVLYELLTGKPPFDGDNLHATMYQVVHKEAPAPSSCCAGLPVAFDDIVARAMAKDPAARYQDAAEMAADLRRIHRSAAATLSGEHGTAAPPAVANPPEPAKLRNRLILAGLGLAIVVATALFVRSPQAPAAHQEAAVPAAPANAAPAPAPRKDTAANPQAPAQKEASATKPTATGGTKGIGGWQAALRADLKGCEAESVFSRVVCIEKARWKHCPGHWGEVADCPSNKGQAPNP